MRGCAYTYVTKTDTWFRSQVSIVISAQINHVLVIAAHPVDKAVGASVEFVFVWLAWLNVIVTDVVHSRKLKQSSCSFSWCWRGLK